MCWLIVWNSDRNLAQSSYFLLGSTDTLKVVLSRVGHVSDTILVILFCMYFLEFFVCRYVMCHARVGLSVAMQHILNHYLNLVLQFIRTSACISMFQ